MFKITTRPETIEKRVIEALRAKVASEGYPKKIDKVASELYDKLTEIMRGAILASNEFNSLVGGKLRADFGLDDNIVSILPGILIDLFEIYYEDAEVSDPKDIFAIRFVVRARSEDDPYMQSAYQRAHYISKKSGEIIQWLRWLLFAGGDVINETYKVKLVDGKGRSGMAIMITGNNFSFRVDEEFSGTARSNMVSRAIDSVKDEMVSVIRSYTNVTK